MFTYFEPSLENKQYVCTQIVVRYASDIFQARQIVVWSGRIKRKCDRSCLGKNLFDFGLSRSKEEVG